MPRVGLLALAPALCAGQVRGVAPGDQARYTADFGCFGSGLALSSLDINDDFCDCEDGSDEPGTEACAGQNETMFYCANAQSDAAYIYASRVNDGVCDCCDGSDEWRAEEQGRQSCANSCAAEGRALKQQRDQQIAELRAGIKQRAGLIGKAKSERAASDKELVDLRLKLTTFESAEASARAALAAAEAALENTTTTTTPAPEAQEANVAEPAEAQPVVSEYSKWMEGAEKEPVVSEYSKWMEGAEKLDAEPVEEVEEVKESTFQWLRSKVSELLRWAMPFGSPEERAVDRAKRQHDEAKKQLKATKSKIRELEEKLKSGVEDAELAFSGLSNRCIEKSIGQYKYKICFFNDAKQDHTSIGRWKGWDAGHAVFEGGQYCPGGPERSLRVKFLCGAEELVDIAEPSRCAYAAEMKHPASCTPELLEALEQRQVRRPSDEL